MNFPTFIKEYRRFRYFVKKILARKKTLEEVGKVTIKESEQEVKSDVKWTYLHLRFDGRLHNIKTGCISVLYFASQVISRMNFPILIKEYKRFKYFVK